MFSGCTALTDASGININFSDSSSWSGYCSFQEMFNNCTTMVKGPTVQLFGELTDRYARTFQKMFYSCQNMVNHDIEFNYSIANGTNTDYGSSGWAPMIYLCYQCKKITKSPRITRDALIGYEMCRAYDGCIKLADVCIDIDDISASNSISNWLANCGTTGTARYIRQKGSATLPTNSTSGVPSGWTLTTSGWGIGIPRMTIYVDDFHPDDYGVTDAYNRFLDEYYDAEREGANVFQHFGDTLTIDGTTYYVWQGIDSGDSNVEDYKILTTTDNFYTLYHESLYCKHNEINPSTDEEKLQVLNTPFSSMFRVLVNDVMYNNSATAEAEWRAQNRLVEIRRNRC